MGTIPAPPPPRTLDMLSRQVDYWRTVYRRTWKGSVVISFIEPWLYVASMGVLLGGYVDAESPDALAGAPSYLAFVVPGLLASFAVQIGADEAMWPVLARIKWDKSYLSMAATPLRVVDIVLGHLGFDLVRVALTCAVFLVPISLLGVGGSVLGVLGAFVAAVLTGMACAAPVYAYAAGARDPQGFALIYRLGVVPMFLFSGAFFPVSQLSQPWETLAALTPLYHGVELTRAAMLGTGDSGLLVHVAYLGTLLAVGLVLGVRRLTRTLVT